MTVVVVTAAAVAATTAVVAVVVATRLTAGLPPQAQTVESPIRFSKSVHYLRTCIQSIQRIKKTA